MRDGGGNGREEMRYRRPQNFEAAVAQLVGCQTFRVSGRSEELQSAITRLSAIGWYDDAMKPLYHANAVCQLVMNSLVPMIQELILEEAVYAKYEAQRDAEKAKRYEAEYDTLLQQMLDVAPLRKEREVTPEFETMAAAMERYAKDAVVQTALRHLFGLMKSARTAFRLIFTRINDALLHHNEILKSDDIPLEALSL